MYTLTFDHLRSLALPDDKPGGGRAVRDSKDPDGPVLTFTAGAWRRFTDEIRTRQPDLP